VHIAHLNTQYEIRDKPVSDPLAAYDFDLPPDQIAQRPAERRDRSRLLVLDRSTGGVEDRTFSDLPDFLRAGDLLVVNDARVIPARLVGTREPGGGRAELFLVAPAADDGAGAVWDVLARPGRKLQPGAQVALPEGLTAEVIAVAPDGARRVRFSGPAGSDVPALMDRVGRVPLPPYIRREEPDAEDRERYQTVYARQPGAVAAPTAGLHFTPELLAAMGSRGVDRTSVTLHVGYGTFEPVRATSLDRHQVAAERAEVSEATAEAVRATRAAGGRVVAVGTTTARALASAADEGGNVRPFAGLAELTVTPDYRFRVVDALLTNFHLPRSSLLILVSAFAGRDATLAAYRHAVAGGYRFYSYGDAMLIS
jgi:S-adenosylmethionine:tRNA ribosyltransferase-isomerase